MKAVAVTETLLYIGMILVTTTLLVTQLPSMVNDMKTVLSKESVTEQSKTIANLLGIVSSSPNEIKITYDFPIEKTYDLAIKDGLVTISTGDDTASAKTNIDIEFEKPGISTITVIKTTDGGINIESE